VENLATGRFEFRSLQSMIHSDLQQVVEEVLACPYCHGPLLLAREADRIYCSACHAVYRIREGIPIFLQGGSIAQEQEKRFRDVLASKHEKSDAETLWEVVGCHHCIPIMRRRADEFRASLQPHEWLLDVGIGYGWHWVGQRRGPRILGVDISLGNLKLARTFLADNDDGVLLVCADAAALPIRENVVSGVWSVQTFQHFPEAVLKQARAELERVVKDEFLMEIYNLNPAWVHRFLYRLIGKRLHQRGKLGGMELNRLSGREWLDVWRNFKGNLSRISIGYSELFFHPEFRFRAQQYPIRLERALAGYTPKLAALFARQVQLRIEAGGVG